MVRNRPFKVFDPELPPDLEHASQIREEAFEWLDTHYRGDDSFATGAVLQMVGESGRRWLISRLRDRGIGQDEALFSRPTAADALAVLFLRSKGVKFGEAVEAMVGADKPPGSAEPRYGGVWNRLLVASLDRLRRRVPPRLLAAAVFALFPDPEDQPNCLFIVKRNSGPAEEGAAGRSRAVGHDYVYRTIQERPPPSCSVIAPSLELLTFGADHLPTRAEVTLRHFVGLHVQTEHEDYGLLLGTMRPASVSVDDTMLEFVGRILDIVFVHFEEFQKAQSSSRFEATTVPEPGSTDELQLWLVTQLLDTVYPNSLSEVIDTSEASYRARALSSSAGKPWEPSLWDPPTSLEMLSGYASRIGVPLVVENVEEPWTQVIKSVEPEMRYLKTKAPARDAPSDFSAMAIPITLSSGDSIGALYMLVPRISAHRLDVEVRIMTMFSRVVGEIIDRQRTAIHSAGVSVNLTTLSTLGPDQFKVALLDLLTRKAELLERSEGSLRDRRLPFLLLSAHAADPDEADPAVSNRLKDWLVETLRHLEWRSFLRSHLPTLAEADGDGGFIGELTGAGMLIALDALVSKDELDRIRNAFPNTLNRTAPTNAPVKLVAWVLDVPAQRILDAADPPGLQALADDIERWAFDVATVVDDVAQSEILAREQGGWDEALRRVRRALAKEGGHRNGYLYRLAADCSFSLGNWPNALRYAQAGATQTSGEMGSGYVRSTCQEADAHLCLGDPVRALDLYAEAAVGAPNHPLPLYYRGQALLLMARLLHEFESERLRTGLLEATEVERIDAVLNELAGGATQDLTSAADLLDRWGLIPESYQYRNFHLVPTLMGQGAAYLLTRSPGPAASSFQSARRSFPRDDLFFREFLFAKCWEQGLHRQYGAMLLGDGWAPLRDRLHKTFGEPAAVHPRTGGFSMDA